MLTLQRRWRLIAGGYVAFVAIAGTVALQLQNFSLDWGSPATVVLAVLTWGQNGFVWLASLALAGFLNFLTAGLAGAYVPTLLASLMVIGGLAAVQVAVIRALVWLARSGFTRLRRGSSPRARAARGGAGGPD